MAELGTNMTLVLIELGAALVGLALLARLAFRWSISAIPLYLLGGLMFGVGGLLPLPLTQEFDHIAAEIGVVLLLFMLGLEYTGEELSANLRTGLPAAAVDFVLNFAPGLGLGLLLGWKPITAILLGGVTYVSSSGIIAKMLTDLRHLGNPETPSILSVLVLEDLAMAIFLPLVSVLLIGQKAAAGALSVLVALVAVGAVLFLALRYGKRLSGLVCHESDEILLLTTFGIVLVVAGLAQQLHVSAAVGAFLVGIALSGPIVARAHRLLSPLRDLFAAIFFFFFGLQTDPAALPPVLGLALGLGIVTALTKILTGWWAARRAGLGASCCARAGVVLTPRGEFALVIAGLGAAANLEPALATLSAAYVLFLAVLGPLLVRAVEFYLKRRDSSDAAASGTDEAAESNACTYYRQ
jgi:CPA2 family monovalent cation:H+ antiporter-2